MAEGKSGDVQFYAPRTRGVIPLDERFYVRKSLRQIIRAAKFDVTFDRNFERVIRECARHTSHNDEEIWLSNEMIPIYIELHNRGIAHSVEVWLSESLVGGLYGLHLGAAFFGESMFSTVPYASQVALVYLVEHLRERSFRLLDAQMPSEHLAQFGLYEIGHKEFMPQLEKALGAVAKF